MPKYHVCALTKDQDVLKSLYAYMGGKNWKSATIILGIGSVYL
jgi:hypothetical protein